MCFSQIIGIIIPNSTYFHSLCVRRTELSPQKSQKTAGDGKFIRVNRVFNFTNSSYPGNLTFKIVLGAGTALELRVNREFVLTEFDTTRLYSSF